jgi:hypothetical protein
MKIRRHCRFENRAVLGYWVITQRVVVILYDVSGQSVGKELPLLAA